MIVMKSSYAILFMCLFMHACNARTGLGLNTPNFPPKKIEEKIRVSMNLNPNLRSGTTIDKRMPTICSKSKDEDKPLCKKKQGNKGATSGCDQDCKSSLQNASKNATKPKGSRRPQHDVREKVLHSSFFSDEDVFVTDYQHPRHKSPIHNK